jgi:hypothetical protein
MVLFAAVSATERTLEFTVAIAQPAAGLPTAPGLLPTALCRRYKVHRIKPEKQKLVHLFFRRLLMMSWSEPVPSCKVKRTNSTTYFSITE